MSTLEAEIKDLSDYLAGLPRELVATGVFSSYEARLDELKRELAAARLRQLAGIGGQQAPASFLDSVRLFLERAESIEHQMYREDRRNKALARALDLGVFLAASGSVFAMTLLLAGSLGLDTLFVAFPGVAVVLMLARFVFEWLRRNKRDQIVADRIHLLRSELGRYELYAISSEEARELSRRVYLLLEDLPGTEAGSRLAA